MSVTKSPWGQMSKSDLRSQHKGTASPGKKTTFPKHITAKRENTDSWFDLEKSINVI